MPSGHEGWRERLARDTIPQSSGLIAGGRQDQRAIGTEARLIDEAFVAHQRYGTRVWAYRRETNVAAIGSGNQPATVCRESHRAHRPQHFRQFAHRCSIARVPRTDALVEPAREDRSSIPRPTGHGGTVAMTSSPEKTTRLGVPRFHVRARANVDGQDPARIGTEPRFEHHAVVRQQRRPCAAIGRASNARGTGCCGRVAAPGNDERLAARREGGRAQRHFLTDG